MTVALGILCADGIVLCADSQETLTFSKVYRPKVFELKSPQEEVKVVLAGAGDGVFLDALKDKIESALALSDPMLDSIRLEVEATVAGYCGKIWSIYGHSKDRPDAQMLIGIRAQDGLMLLHCDGPKVRRVPDYESIGFGGDFSTYHLKKLFKPAMSISEASPVAVHVLEVVKDNVDYCGGPSQVYVIRLNGDVEQKSEEYFYVTNLAFNRTSHFASSITAKAASLIRSDVESAYAMEDFFEYAWDWLKDFIDDAEKRMDAFIAECRAEWAREKPVSEKEIRDALERIEKKFGRTPNKAITQDAPHSDSEDEIPF